MRRSSCAAAGRSEIFAKDPTPCTAARICRSVLDLEELTLPFFSRRTTKFAIDALGHLSPLLVFVGAGVTVDRTGLTWETMVTRLLGENDRRCGATADLAAHQRLVATLGARQAGSVAAERWVEASGPDWQVQVSRFLQSELYGTEHWLGGRLPSAIARLWLDLGDRANQILTTNYDEHIEIELRKLTRFLGTTGGHAMADEQWPSDSVVHLHGDIASNRISEDYPVISEDDYARRSEQVAARLEEAFRDSHILILGSRVEDPHVVAALLGTKVHRMRRFAVIPRSDADSTIDSEESVQLLRDVNTRLKHLGVEGLFVDHYSQISQLLAEIRLASVLAPETYPRSPQRYGERLNNWRRDWNAQTESIGYAERQARDHRALAELTRWISEELQAKDEELRLEVWLRRDPVGDDRTMRLWASSYAQFSHDRLTRCVRIEPDSPFAAVRAFTEGKVIYDEAITTALRRSGTARSAGTRVERPPRWNTFIAAPLEPLGEFNLVVGSVVLSSMKPPGASRLSKERRGEHSRPIAEAKSLGEAIASDAAAGLGYSRPHSR